MTSQWQTKQLNSPSDLVYRKVSLAERFGQLWQAITHNTSAPAVEIRQVTEQGRPWWYVYETATGEMTYLESEQDIDMWLEEQLRQ